MPIRAIETKIVVIKQQSPRKLGEDIPKEATEIAPSLFPLLKKEETKPIEKPLLLKEYDAPSYLQSLNDIFIRLFSHPYSKLEPLNKEMMKLKNELIHPENNYFLQFILETAKNDSLEFLNKHFSPSKSADDLKRTKACLLTYLFFMEDFFSVLEKKGFVINDSTGYKLTNLETKKQLQSLLYEVLSHLIHIIIYTNLSKFEALADKEYRLNIHPNKTREILASFAFYIPNIRKKIRIFEN